jgi:hypothetical protein
VVGRNLSADPPWFIMPRAEGSLATDLQAGRHGERLWVVDTFSAIVSGMAYAHSQRRILHRDLKPENVLLVGGIPMISDFGLGKRLDPNTVDLTQSNIGMGTMAYMAPEQFTDAAHVGPPADVYALGKMLGEMLTGRRPIVGRPRLQDFPEEFRSFIEKCTEDDPTDRYANAADALAAFRLLVSGGTGGKESEALESLLKRWEVSPAGEEQDVVRAIATNLVGSRDDEELHWRALPRLPARLVEQLIEHHLTDFDLVLRAYNRHIEGGLPFEYCDVVANFYRQVFRSSPDIAHKQLVLERLVSLGPSHNRWHVGNVVAGLLTEIGDNVVAEMAAQLIRSDPLNARWFEPYVRNRTLPIPIASAFDSLSPTVSDDIPF